MKSIRLAGAYIEFHKNGLTITRYPHGVVPAYAQDDDAYRQRASALGYGNDVHRMSREHEITHSLLARWLGLSASPTLHAIASGTTDKDWPIEEDAVKAIQRFARAKGIDLIDIASLLDESGR